MQNRTSCISENNCDLEDFVLEIESENVSVEDKEDKSEKAFKGDATPTQLDGLSTKALDLDKNEKECVSPPSYENFPTSVVRNFIMFYFEQIIPNCCIRCWFLVSSLLFPFPTSYLDYLLSVLAEGKCCLSKSISSNYFIYDNFNLRNLNRRMEQVDGVGCLERERNISTSECSIWHFSSYVDAFL